MHRDFGGADVEGVVGAKAGDRVVARPDAVRHDVVTRHVDQADERAVRHRAVVAFQEVVDDRLPVGGDVIAQPVGVGQPVEVGRGAGDLGGEVAGPIGERRGRRIQIDEHHVCENLEPQFLERPIAGAAGVVEREAVARAGQRIARPVDHPVRPGRAQVVKGAQAAALAARDDDLVIEDAADADGPRRAQLFGMRHTLPGAPEDRRLLGLEDGGVGVEPRRQGERARRIGVVAATNVALMRADRRHGASRSMSSGRMRG